MVGNLVGLNPNPPEKNESVELYGDEIPNECVGFIANLVIDDIIGTNGSRTPSITHAMRISFNLPDMLRAWNGNIIFQKREAVWNSHHTAN